jgi:membrane protease YdiL (CAAX protease family)
VSEPAADVHAPLPSPVALGARPISPLERLGAFAEVALCSGFPTQLLLASLMAAFGMELRTAEGRWSPTFVSTLSLIDAALVIGLVFLFLASHRERARDVLIGARPVAREIAFGMVLLPALFLFAVVVRALLYLLAPQLHNVPRNPLEDMLQTPRDAVLFGFVVVLAGGVREEIQRGFILHRFKQYLGGGLFGVLAYSGIIFGLGHIDQGVDAAITIASLGAIWGTIYLIRKSIVAPMVSHAGFNLAQLINFLALR